MRCYTNVWDVILMCGMQAGLTPLHVAASEGHLEVVRNLLLYGAEPNLSSKPSQPWPGKGYTRIASKLPQGRQTAADLAAGKGHKDIVQLLNWAKPVSKFVHLLNCVHKLIRSTERMSCKTDVCIMCAVCSHHCRSALISCGLLTSRVRE